MKKIFIYSTKVIVYLILIFSVFLLITSKTDLIGGIRSYVVLTGSMQPTIPTGSVVFSKKLPHYQNGNIITYKSGNVTVTHRVQQVQHIDNKLTYKTKGDANTHTDSRSIEEKDVLGKTMLYVPYIGRLVIFLKTLPGFLLLFILPAAIIITLELFNIKKEIVVNIEKKYLIVKSVPIESGSVEPS